MSVTYTVKQVAQILGYSTNSIYTFLKEKRIKAVRVGKGRFRIPQSELERLLGENKNRSSIAVNDVKNNPERKSDNSVLPAEVFHVYGINVPCLTEWLIGFLSLVTGASLTLFSGPVSLMFPESLISLKPFLITSLFAGGSGLLMTEIKDKGSTVWNIIFRALVVISFGLLTWISFSAKAFDGLMVFGITLLLAFSGFIVKGKPAVIFYIYAISTVLFLPFSGMISPGNNFLNIEAFTAGKTGNFIYLWVGLWMFMAAVFLFKYNRSYITVSIVSFFLSFSFVLYSLIYAKAVIWEVAFIFLIVSLFALFAPFWHTLKFEHRKDRRLVFSTLFSVILLFLCAIGVVRIMENNIINFAKRQQEEKATFAKFLIESDLEKGILTLENGATNFELFNALKKRDTRLAESLLRSLYDSRGMFKRLVLYDTGSSETASTYPLTTSKITQDVLLKEFFKLSAMTGKTRISDLFTSDDGTKTIILAVPVKPDAENVTGVLAGMIDLSVVANKLQQVTSGRIGEYIIVIDRRGKIVIHPDPHAISNQVQKNSKIREFLEKPIGTFEENIAGNNLISSYVQIPDYEWALGIFVPVAAVVAATYIDSITVFLILVLAVAIIAVSFLSLRKKIKPPEDTS